MNKLPDRWMAYKPFGNVVEGTSFVPFKVPLDMRYFKFHKRILECDWFTPDMVKNNIKNLGLIIDLTATTRYYDPQAFRDRGIAYVKLSTEGTVIPKRRILNRFVEIVNNFLKENDQSKSIGVHCTHGVNRTGYLICKYMVTNLNIAPKDAILKFQMARGHPIERQNYVMDLHRSSSVNDESWNRARSSEEKDRRYANKYQQRNNNDYFEDTTNWRELCGRIPSDPERTIPRQYDMHQPIRNDLFVRRNTRDVEDTMNWRDLRSRIQSDHESTVSRAGGRYNRDERNKPYSNGNATDRDEYSSSRYLARSERDGTHMNYSRNEQYPTSSYQSGHGNLSWRNPNNNLKDEDKVKSLLPSFCRRDQSSDRVGYSSSRDAARNDRGSKCMDYKTSHEFRTESKTSSSKSSQDNLSWRKPNNEF